MSSMHALTLLQDGRPTAPGIAGDTLDRADLFLEQATIPVPQPGPGQVLIKVQRATANPSDLGFIQGFYGQPRVKGAPAGFEGTGRVVDAGAGMMARWLKGKAVAFYVTPDGSGAWAEYAVTRAEVALPLKRGVPEKDAGALIVNPLTTAAMIDLVAPGDAFVFSAAASQLGKLMAPLARAQGKRMIAIARRDAPLAGLKRLGATHGLNETAPDFGAELADVLAREKPVIFLDAVSGGASPQIFRAMGKRARWVIYGKLDPRPAEILEPGELIFLGKKIEGFWTTQWSAQTPIWKRLRIAGQVQGYFRDGLWSTDVAAELPLAEAVARLPAALAERDGKTQIVMPASDGS